MDLETFGRYFDQGVAEMAPEEVPKTFMVAMGWSSWQLWTFEVAPWSRWESEEAGAVRIPVVIGCAYDPIEKSWIMVASPRITHMALKTLSYPAILKVARELEATSSRSSSGPKALRNLCRLYQSLLPPDVYSAMQVASADLETETHIY